MLRTALFLAAAGCLLHGVARAAAVEQAGSQNKGGGVAVLDFGYSDTSGESQNSAAEHRARLEGLASGLRTDLSAGGRYRVVTPICRPQPCEVGSTPFDDLITAAREAGAKLLVVGAVHKESTLIEWAKVLAINVDDKRIVLDKLISFRGDSEEAWTKAESFIAREIQAVGVLGAADPGRPVRWTALDFRPRDGIGGFTATAASPPPSAQNR